MQLIFEELITNIIFLNINLTITINNKLSFDVSFSYLHCKSCHPPYTKSNITRSLIRRIVRIAFDNKNNWLQELKDHLLKSKYREKIIDYSFAKLFQSRKHESNEKIFITFTKTYNPNHQFSFNKCENYIRSAANKELQKAFNDKKYSLQHENQINLKIYWYQRNLKLKQSRYHQNLTRFFFCDSCASAKAGYIIPCSSFSFKLTNKNNINTK